MKFFTNKTFWFKLIVCFCFCLALFGLGISTVSQADTSWGFNTARSAVMTGGKLIGPVVDLLLGIGDAIINVIQQAIMGTEAAVTIDTAKKIIFVIIAAVAAIFVVGLAVAFVGPIVAKIALLKLVAGAAGVAKLALTVGTFYAAYTCLNGAFLPDITVIPTYSISPEELFKGEILLFDVNIFNPREVWVEVYLPDNDPYADASQNVQNAVENKDGSASKRPVSAVISWEQEGKGEGYDSTSKTGILYVYNDKIAQSGNILQYKTYDDEDTWITYNKGSNEGITKIENVKEFVYDRQHYYWESTVSFGGYTFQAYKVETDENGNSKKVKVPSGHWIDGNSSQTNSSTTGSEETNQDEISNIPKINALDTQTMTAKKWKEVSTAGNDGYETYKNYKVNYYYYHKDRDTTNNDDSNRIITSANNSAVDLKNTTAKWYYAMRNLAVVLLMVVLVYMGIRMLTSSIASEKAKYKQMMTDWFVALCLIFIMQYIMVFLNNFTESVVELFSSISDNKIYTVTIDKPKNELINGLKTAGLEQYVDKSNNQINIVTNLMGKVRLLAQEQTGTSLYIGYAVCFLVLVLYTIIFTYVYAKRLLYTIFLTIIAPLVAISYPIDKIGDGKSQAFDMWLKEYVFNLIIQPFHLLLYIVLISTAFDLAGSNVIYSLIAIGFMIPAEKFLRKMFGFDKASTPGFLGGAAGAAVAMTAISKVGKFAERGAKGKQMPSGGNDKIKFAENDNDDKRSADKGKGINSLLNDINKEDGNGKPMLDGQEDNKSTYQDSYNDVEKAMFGDEEVNEGLNGGDENYSGDYADVYNATLPTNSIEGNPIDKPEENSGVKPEKTYGEAVWSGIKSGWRENFDFSKGHRIETIGNLAKKGAPSMKSAARIASGIAGAGLGAATGIASGAPDNVMKNAGLGAYAGASVAKGTVGGASGMISSTIDGVKATREANLKEQYGSQYSNYVKQKLDEKFLRDKERAKVYADELGLKTKEEISAAMQDAVKYRQHGMRDDKTIIKAMKSDGGNASNRADPERIAASLLAGKAKSQQDYNKVIEALSKQTSQTKVDSISRKIKAINKDDNLI